MVSSLSFLRHKLIRSIDLYIHHHHQQQQQIHFEDQSHLLHGPLSFCITISVTYPGTHDMHDPIEQFLSVGELGHPSESINTFDDLHINGPDHLPWHEGGRWWTGVTERERMRWCNNRQYQGGRYNNDP